MVEIWRDIKGFEGYYQVSNMGNIKTVKRIVSFGKNKRIVVEELKTLVDDKDGYKDIILYKNGEHRHVKVHRVVAETFIPNPKGYKEINHKNENKADNRVENLEWCSRKYNNDYGNRTKSTRETQSVRINQYSLDGVFIKSWLGARIIERVLGFSNANIIKCCKGKAHTAYGFIWKYADEDKK